MKNNEMPNMVRLTPADKATVTRIRERINLNELKASQIVRLALNRFAEMLEKKARNK